MHYRIGIDVGGTFTDCVLLRPDGSVVLEKAPTTPEDQSRGVLAGLSQLAAAEGISVEVLAAGTRTIVHGTTTGDNTMIQMSGATTGLASAVASRVVSVDADPRPPRMPLVVVVLPGETMSRLLPSWLIWLRTCACAPWPRPTVSITAAMPIRMPSMVSPDRSR